MRFRRRFIRFAAAGLALALLASLQPHAQAQGANSVYLALRYDLDRPDANPFFCGPAVWMDVPGRLKTSGSSTTVTEVTASSLPLRDIVVGDTLMVQRGAPGPTTVDLTTLTAKASGASVTVDTAVNWDNSGAGYRAQFIHNTCGQAATDGWFSVSQYKDFNVVVEWQQGDLGGGLDWKVECRDGLIDASPVQVFPTLAVGVQNIATAGLTSASSGALVGFERWQSCRVGLLAHTADASDAGANLERVRVVVIGTPGGGN